MMSESQMLSQTLQSITTEKMRELNRRRDTFEASKSKVLNSVAESADHRARLGLLLSTYKDSSWSNKGISWVEQDRKEYAQNADRYLEQSYRDPSVSTAIIENFQHRLELKLQQESQRFDFANLYYRLLSEWTDPNTKPMASSKEGEDDLGGSFEHVQRYDLQKLKEKFAGVVFTPLETDDVEIDNYLSGCFEDDLAQRLLCQIRQENVSFAQTLKDQTTPFDRRILQQCIRALLSNNLLNEEAKKTLSEFTTNEVVLDEIADVLNLRFADIDGWSWQADQGMYYEPRRQLNGKYRITMDMDILQAIFLHYIAVSWCAHIKRVFHLLPYNTKFWQTNKKMNEQELQRHYFFTGLPRSSNGINATKRHSYLSSYFMSSMPSSLTDGGDPYGEDGENDAEDETRTGLGLRQMFLRQLATDVLIHRSLYGEVAVVQSDLQWYATGLSHSTLFAVLRFWGIPKDWISFFKKYAEAPLRMSPTPGENVHTRKRGIPITDAFEIFFGEVVLFCMDVAVNRKSGMNLIRFHDDLWLHGEPSQTAMAWETISDFVKVLGLDINTSKTGSVYITDTATNPEVASKFPEGPVSMGMLQLSNKGEWKIDQKQVDAHTRQLERQLGQCDSIISWVVTWNACVGRFFQDTFGRPANCFGQAHIDSILETHANMQRKIFDAHGGSVTEYLRRKIHERFAVPNIPDSFVFLPEEFGGLGVKNPFVPLFMLKHQILQNPADRLAEFRDRERRAYKEASETFATLRDSEKQSRLDASHSFSTTHASLMDENFFSFEEFSSHRETYSYYLLAAFDELMLKPSVQEVHLAKETGPWFEELRYSHGKGWHSLDNDAKWIMQLHAEELKQRFGALSIIDRNLLPSGIMKMLKKKKVTWQLIIWE